MAELKINSSAVVQGSLSIVLAMSVVEFLREILTNVSLWTRAMLIIFLIFLILMLGLYFPHEKFTVAPTIF